MIGIEYGSRVGEFKLVGGFLVPRHVEDPFKVRADQMSIGRVLGQGAQPFEFAFGLFFYFFGKLNQVEPLAQFVDFA